MVITANALKAPKNTIRRECLTDINAAMKYVLSPTSMNKITKNEVTNPLMKEVWSAY